MNSRKNILAKKLSRREALSTAGKVAISAVVAGVVAGVGGYLAGSAAAPGRETVTETKTVTSTVGAATVTETKTVTAGAATVTQTQTVTQTITRTVTAGAPPTEIKPEITITFASPEWLPGRLTGLIAEKFPEWSARKLGKAVAVKMDLIPWGVIHDRITTTLAAKSKEPTLLISDSQWLGELYVGGHILRMNPIIEKDPELQQLLNRFDESLVNYYMTYPQGNRNNIVGFGHEGDVIALVVRRDILMHPGERENFKAQFGYDLPTDKYEDWFPAQVDWTQIRDMAKFFTRKAGDEIAGKRLEEDFYGIAVHMSKEYDALACLFGTILYCWGEYWWDPVTGQVEGIVNSERALKALEFYRSLIPYSPPNYLELWFDQCNAVMQAWQGLHDNKLGRIPAKPIRPLSIQSL
jgi:multiple sugar transport system substrate-binding protein